VLKKDCLDLPEKVYTQTFFRLTPAQLKAYKLLKDDLRLQLEDGRIAPMARIGALTKLSQIVSGYFLVPGTENDVQRIMPTDKNPKFKALLDLLEDAEGQIIIWARFRVEIEDICQILRKENITHVQYHGGIKRTDRPQAIKDFESGAVRVFVGQQAAGGTGITLIAPNSASDTITVIYFSNTFALEDRLQSEDRAHRIGQDKTVLYVDIIAQDTIDERIVESLKSKVNLAQHVLGDKRRALDLLE
jgi:SNF2 family DNA or RNA helicase